MHPMKKHIVHTDKAPAAVGPYSQAVRVGRLIFTAGQVGLDPSTGQLVEGLEAQTRQALENIAAVLAAAGTDLQHVVKTTIYLTDLNAFAQVNAIYGEYFTHDPPARTTVQVAALPLGALIEIEAVAVLPESPGRT